MKQSKNHHALNGAEDGGAGTRGQENYQILQFPNFPPMKLGLHTASHKNRLGEGDDIK